MQLILGIKRSSSLSTASARLLQVAPGHGICLGLAGQRISLCLCPLGGGLCRSLGFRVCFGLCCCGRCIRSRLGCSCSAIREHLIDGAVGIVGDIRSTRSSQAGGT